MFTLLCIFGGCTLSDVTHDCFFPWSEREYKISFYESLMLLISDVTCFEFVILGLLALKLRIATKTQRDQSYILPSLHIFSIL